jgi:hypothetical protein
VERRPGQRDYPTGTQEDRPGETEEGARHRWFSSAKRLSGGPWAGHRGLSAGSQRHFRRSDGQDVERLPTGIVFGAHLVAANHGGVFAKMDEVRAGEDVTVEVQAFADEQLVLISASSLAKLEAAWDKTWAACQLWASTHKLEYAPEKTAAILVPAKSGLVRFGQNRKSLSGRTQGSEWETETSGSRRL